MFAERMNRMRGSIIREILKFMADPELISFGGGSPATEALPAEAIREITDRLLAEQGPKLLQYGITEGWLPLREAYLAHIAGPKGIRAGLDNVLITTGATQSILLACEAFLNENDVVLVESPTFLSALMVYQKLNCRCVAVQTDGQGIIPADLEEKMRVHRPKMLYTIPTFQNPTGRTLPLERRRAIAQLASRYDVMVLEDDPYCDLRYTGAALPAIKSFDESGHVILLNSFSKIIAPGLRVGSVVAEPEMIRKMTILKQYTDTHTPSLPQAICAEFLNRGLLPDHLTRVNALYKARMEAMLASVAREFPQGTEYTRPEGGLFTWSTVPEDVDVQKLLDTATGQYKVAFIPGGPFFPDPEQGKHLIRLNFSSNTPQNIALGMEKLGAAIGQLRGSATQ